MAFAIPFPASTGTWCVAMDPRDFEGGAGNIRPNFHVFDHYPLAWPMDGDGRRGMHLGLNDIRLIAEPNRAPVPFDYD